MNSLCHGKYLPTEVNFSPLPGTKWVYQQHYCACAIPPPALRKPFLAPGTEDSIGKAYLSVQGLYGHRMGAGIGAQGVGTVLYADDHCEPDAKEAQFWRIE